MDNKTFIWTDDLVRQYTEYFIRMQYHTPEHLKGKDLVDEFVKAVSKPIEQKKDRIVVGKFGLLEEKTFGGTYKFESNHEILYRHLPAIKEAIEKILNEEEKTPDQLWQESKDNWIKFHTPPQVDWEIPSLSLNDLVSLWDDDLNKMDIITSPLFLRFYQYLKNKL